MPAFLPSSLPTHLLLTSSHSTLKKVNGDKHCNPLYPKGPGCQGQGETYLSASCPRTHPRSTLKIRGLVNRVNRGHLRLDFQFCLCYYQAVQLPANPVPLWASACLGKERAQMWLRRQGEESPRGLWALHLILHLSNPALVSFIFQASGKISFEKKIW